MKKINLAGWAVPMLMAAALCVFTPGLRAQDQQAPPPQQQTQSQDQARTFQGTVEKLQNGTYALVTGKTPDGKLSGHFLDDQDGARKYEGKQVKVTGTLDMASNTIHVTKIEAA
jgi:hypothetical protein